MIKPKITIAYLKELFYKKYGGGIFSKTPVEVLVTLTPEQFEDLNDDLLRSTNTLLMMIEESEYMYDPGSVLFSRISTPDCEFILEIGQEFEFGLLDRSEEHGDETL